MFTIAHEMGHALHSYYSDQEQPYLYAQYTIFVAEVASTVNESLLMDWMLKNTTDKKEKMYLLNHYLEQFRGTVFRQTMFAEFEKMTHEKVEKGEALTPEALNKMYHDLNKDYYGEGVVIDEISPWNGRVSPIFTMPSTFTNMRLDSPLQRLYHSRFCMTEKKRSNAISDF